MALSVDLLDVIDNPVYHIDYERLELIEEVLVPVNQNDWSWYSYSRDKYLPETDVFQSKEEALEILLGLVISAKKNVILSLESKERWIINQLSPEYEDEGLIG